MAPPVIALLKFDKKAEVLTVRDLTRESLLDNYRKEQRWKYLNYDLVKAWHAPSMEVAIASGSGYI